MSTTNTTTEATEAQAADVMSVEEARELTDAIKGNLGELAKHILRAMEGKAYKALGFKSVKAWAEKEFGLSRSRIYQMAAWKRAEAILIETFHLAEDWASNEEALRLVDWNELLVDATAELPGIADQDRRGVRLGRLINAKFDAIKQRERERNNSAASAASDESSQAVAAPKGSDAVYEMSAPVNSAPYYLVKARDTGVMLAELTENDSADDVLAAAELALEDLNTLILQLKGESK